MEKKENNDVRTKVYELGYILVPTIAEEQVAGEVEPIKALIEKHGGSFISDDFPKFRPLAYTMIKAIGSQKHRHDKGYFGWIKFEIDSAETPKIKAVLDKNDSILRFMIIETVRENTMMTQKMIFKPTPDAAKDTPAEGAAEEGEAKEPVSEEELDKTIDNLVV
jgi:ribosomal protein S6